MVKEFTFTYEEKKKLAAQTAEILTEEIGLKGDAIQAVQLVPEIDEGKLSMADVEAQYGAPVVRELPQPAALVCRGHAGNPDYDCRPCEPDADPAQIE